jgi:hypothetical protein
MTIYNFEHTPIYEIGNKVYHVSTHSVEKFLDCPDCLGARKWEITSPVGEKYSMPCPRCQARHTYDDYSLNYYEYTDSIRELTIGSVRIDTSDTKNPIEYMCLETGVGSGSIYKECDLHANKLCAKLYGEQLVNKRNKHDPDRIETYKGRVEMSRHYLHLIPKEQVR